MVTLGINRFVKLIMNSEKFKLKKSKCAQSLFMALFYSFSAENCNMDTTIISHIITHTHTLVNITEMWGHCRYQ